MKKVEIILIVLAIFVGYFLTTKKVVVDNSCQRDSDCQLVNDNSWSNCSLSTACQPADYSQDRWVSINAQWYAQVHDKNCPSENFPKMACDPKPINDNFGPKCIANKCQKAPS